MIASHRNSGCGRCVVDLVIGSQTRTDRQGCWRDFQGAIGDRSNGVVARSSKYQVAGIGANIGAGSSSRSSCGGISTL